MKLSEAIEYCLARCIWQSNHYYMCHALQAIGEQRHVPAVMEMVHSIHPDCVSLAGALHMRQYVEDVASKSVPYRMQLYCWWVFDLKRKGL